MDIMHPLRWKMIEIALEVLPFHHAQPLAALDLGVGTGVFTKRFLEEYPHSHVVGIDAASAMLELAKLRLGALSERVELIVSDFRKIPTTVLKPNRFDAVISSYALHHLNAEEKLAVLKPVVSAIKPSGWFLNADVVEAEGEEVERRVQEIRVKAISGRAPMQDKRFSTHEKTRAFLDDLETREQDQPQSLNTDIRILREAGIEHAEVFWKEYREVVIGGPKASST